jgi:hypothetical protein
MDERHLKKKDKKMVTAEKSYLKASDCNKLVSFVDIPDNLPELILFCAELRSTQENLSNRLDYINKRIDFIEELVKVLLRRES